MKDQHLEPAVIATYAEWDGALQTAHRLTESLRTFGGKYRDVPIWLYVPRVVMDEVLADSATVASLKAMGVEIIPSAIPDDARRFFYGGKPYAAAAAEKAADGKYALLIWLDDDTVVLGEPVEFGLDDKVSLAYTPVMHNRSGTLYDEEPTPFWARIYELLKLTDEELFPMVTPADHDTIRAYFHCGQYSLRPEKGILRRWADDFTVLSGDSVLVDMCRETQNYRIFLHQTALTSAVLHKIGRDEMVSLSDNYNYPIFFERQYGADQPFDNIEGVATIRCVVSLEEMGENWSQDLSGPPDRIAWLQANMLETGH